MLNGSNAAQRVISWNTPRGVSTIEHAARKECRVRERSRKNHRRQRRMRSAHRVMQFHSSTTTRRRSQRPGFQHPAAQLAARTQHSGRFRPSRVSTDDQRAASNHDEIRAFDAAVTAFQCRPATTQPAWLSCTRDRIASHFTSRGQSQRNSSSRFDTRLRDRLLSETLFLFAFSGRRRATTTASDRTARSELDSRAEER